jgi:6-pyruvoyltetrahydropterin/6-carboxytetrahydropterin synthase
MFELSQRFYFEAAHTLSREIETASSKRVHGHTYIAIATVRGAPDPSSGMVMDLGHLRAAIETVRAKLDHHFLNEVEGVGLPTLENLCMYVFTQLHAIAPALCRVTIKRDASGDSCTYAPGA